MKAMVAALCRKHATCNPYDLARACGVIVLEEPLGAILGYYRRTYRKRVIHVNESLKDYLRRYVVAHQLAIILLHPKRKATRYMLDLMPRTDQECEAENFALLLLAQRLDKE